MHFAGGTLQSCSKAGGKGPEKHLFGQEDGGPRASFISRNFLSIPRDTPLSLTYKRNCTLEGEKPVNHKAR